jgi:integrase
MNRRPPGLQLSTCIEGFLQYKNAEGLSPTTISNYECMLRKWLEYQGDVRIGEITTQSVRAYLAWLRTEYKPRRTCGGQQPLSPKTIRNVWVTLSSFFRWASIEFDLPSPMSGVPAPQFKVTPVEPFTKDDILALLKASKYCRETVPYNRRRFTTRRPTARRDEAIILTLLDTGLRATELCSLRVEDFDPKLGRIEVRHGVSGGAKGGKKIWVAAGAVVDGVLHIQECYRAEALPSSGRERDRCLAAVWKLVAAEKTAAFGFDFPFGLPRELVAELDWETFTLAFPTRYRDAEAFRRECRAAAGAGELRRRTDSESKTPFSPYNLRLYRQTYYGIRDLLHPLVRDRLASVLPMQRPAPDRPWVLEICPASTVKREGLPTSFKGKAHGSRRAAREIILGSLERTGRLVVESKMLRALVLDDSGGDALDSIIAAFAVVRALRDPAGLVSANQDYRIEGYVYV